MSIPYDYRKPIRLLDEIILIDPWLSVDECESKCIYCNAPEHLGRHHFHGCPFVLAQEYIQGLSPEQKKDIFGKITDE